MARSISDFHLIKLPKKYQNIHNKNYDIKSLDIEEVSEDATDTLKDHGFDRIFYYEQE